MASLTVGRVRGIPVRLHVTFLLLLPVFAWLMARAYFSEGAQEGWPGTSAWIWGSLLALGLFGSVLLHELSHSLMALRERIGVDHITLLPIGGVSAFSEMPRDPGTEFRVTIVGPLTNFVLAAPLLAAWWLGVVPASPEGLPRFVMLLGSLNLFVGAFNLLVPAFPMDGGRILRAVLALRVGRMRATRIAAFVGRSLAVLMGLAGLVFGAWLLVLVAIFVYIGAGSEEQATRLTESLGAFRVGDIMTRDVDVASPGETAHVAQERMLRTKRLVLPVVDDGRAVGLLTLDAVARVQEAERYAVLVGDLMQREFPTLRPDEEAAEAGLRLAHGGAALVVEPDGRLAGILTASDVQRVAVILSAGGVARRPARSA